MSTPIKSLSTANSVTPQPRRLLMVWWSNTGGTRQLVQAAAAAARGESDIEVRMLQCDEAGPSDLLAADALLFAAPEMLGTMAGRMKDFFDRCYYPVFDSLAGRAYGLIVCAGSDGQGAVRQFQRICTGWRLRLIAEPLIVCTHAQTPEAIAATKVITRADLERAAQLGASLAAGVALGVW